MGITGLLPFLNDASRSCHIREFKGCVAAIDSYSWLHKGAFGCASSLVNGVDTDVFVKYCMKYIELLQSNNIKPILVFDGQHLAVKKDTEKKRRDARACARLKGQEMLCLGKPQEALRFFRQCVDITHKMALALIKVCRAINVDCIVAPYEADAQMAYLNRKHIVDIVITEDSDLVVFGCTKILFKLDLKGDAVLVEHDKLIRAMKIKPQLYSFEKFQYMCILSGCDYLESLPGIGLMRAHKVMTRALNVDIYRILQRLPAYLNMKQLVVSEEYIEKFKQAEAAFKYQIVYNPIERKLVHFTTPDDCDIHFLHLKSAGEMYDNNMAFQMALGNIDPISKMVLDNWHPDELLIPLKPTSIWSRAGPKVFKRRTNTTLNIKNQEALKFISKVNVQAASEAEMIDYDTKLQKELRMYGHYEQVEPEVNNAEIGEVKISEELYKEIQFNNPFLKHKPKPLSKFGTTTIDTSEVVKSRFFKTDSTFSDPKSNNVDDEIMSIFNIEALCPNTGKAQMQLCMEKYSSITPKKRISLVNTNLTEHHNFEKDCFTHMPKMETMINQTGHNNDRVDYKGLSPVIKKSQRKRPYSEISDVQVDALGIDTNTESDLENLSPQFPADIACNSPCHLPEKITRTERFPIIQKSKMSGSSTKAPVMITKSLQEHKSTLPFTRKLQQLTITGMFSKMEKRN